MNGNFLSLKNKKVLLPYLLNSLSYFYPCFNKNNHRMLSIIIGTGANIFILIVVILIGIITGISFTDILKTKEKSED